MKPSAFVSQSVKHMSAFNHKKQFEMSGLFPTVTRPTSEIDKYERTAKHRFSKIYQAGERRRERV